MRLAVAEMDSTRDHFELNPWQDGERRLTFHLTLDGNPELAAAARRVHEALGALPPARLVPVEWLHLTMSGFGRVGEVSSEALAQIEEGVFSRWEEFSHERISYDQLLVAHESVMLTARIDDWLPELARVQREVVDEVLGQRQWRQLWPHSSLAYMAGAVPAEQLRECLAGVAAALPDAVEARPTLTLMELARDTGNYEWRVLRSA
ncbi:hypothetical protein GCM10027030_02820 [Luteococcus sediminum]